MLFFISAPINISGSRAEGNLIEHTLIEGSTTADGVGIDLEAGGNFGGTANILRDCEIWGAADKGIKVTTGSYARVERCWIHDNVNGGIQATLGGHVQAWHNLVERNRGGSAQNGLAANPPVDSTGGDFSELVTWGNISRANGSDGVSVRGGSHALLSDDYLAAKLSQRERLRVVPLGRRYLRGAPRPRLGSQQ